MDQPCLEVVVIPRVARDTHTVGKKRSVRNAWRDQEKGRNRSIIANHRQEASPLGFPGRSLEQPRGLIRGWVRGGPRHAGGGPGRSRPAVPVSALLDQSRDPAGRLGRLHLPAEMVQPPADQAGLLRRRVPREDRLVRGLRGRQIPGIHRPGEAPFMEVRGPAKIRRKLGRERSGIAQRPYPGEISVDRSRRDRRPGIVRRGWKHKRRREGSATAGRLGVGFRRKIREVIQADKSPLVPGWDDGLPGSRLSRLPEDQRLLIE